MKSRDELLEKYEGRNLMEELDWAAHYTRKGYMTQEYEDYYSWLALAAYMRIKELEANNQPKRITHYDEIRMQTPYEMADWIAHILVCHGAFVQQIDRLDCDKECPLYKCCNDQPYDNIEDWLNMPVEEGSTNG